MNVAVTNVTRNKRREAERSSKLSAVKIPKQEDMLAIVFNTCASVVLFSVQNASSFLDSVPAQAFAGQIPAIYWDLPWSPLNNRKKTHPSWWFTLGPINITLFSTQKFHSFMDFFYYYYSQVTELCLDVFRKYVLFLLLFADPKG